MTSEAKIICRYCRNTRPLSEMPYHLLEDSDPKQLELGHICNTCKGERTTGARKDKRFLTFVILDLFEKIREFVHKKEAFMYRHDSNDVVYCSFFSFCNNKIHKSSISVNGMTFPVCWECGNAARAVSIIDQVDLIMPHSHQRAREIAESFMQHDDPRMATAKEVLSASKKVGSEAKSRAKTEQKAETKPANKPAVNGAAIVKDDGELRSKPFADLLTGMTGSTPTPTDDEQTKPAN